VVAFSAKGDSRISLYEAMANKFALELGWVYKTKRINRDEIMLFVGRKKILQPEKPLIDKLSADIQVKIHDDLQFSESQEPHPSYSFLSGPGPDKPQGEQIYKIEDLERRTKLFEFFGKNLHPYFSEKFLGLAKYVGGAHYREDFSSVILYKESETGENIAKKKVLDKNGKIIKDKKKLQELERALRAGEKTAVLKDKQNLKGKADKTEEELKSKRDKSIQAVKEARKDLKNRIHSNVNGNHSMSRINSVVKKPLRNLFNSNEKNKSKIEKTLLDTFNKITLTNSLNEKLMVAFINEFKLLKHRADKGRIEGFDNNDFNAFFDSAIKSLRNIQDGLKSLHQVELIVYDSQAKTPSYTLEHLEAMIKAAYLNDNSIYNIITDNNINFNQEFKLPSAVIPTEMANAKNKELKTGSRDDSFNFIINTISGKSDRYTAVRFNKENNKPEIINIQESRSKAIDEMVERKKGIAATTEISELTADILGKTKGRFKFFIPPSADDFAGLMYYLAGKGKQGDADLKFFKENLFDPFAKGINAFESYKQNTLNNFREFKRAIRKTPAALSKKNSTGLTNEAAVRVYLWNKKGIEIPGITETEIKNLVEIVEKSAELKEFASLITNLTLAQGYPEPSNDWWAGSMTIDILDSINTEGRDKFLSEFNDNIEEIFGKVASDGKLKGPIANKLKAAFGQNYLDALSDSIYRMQKGRAREFGKNKLTGQLQNWINDSVGAIMFFNVRSALLQQISTINFINLSDNNPLKVAKTIADPKQFWTDYATIFNSDFLKQRRAGLKTDVNADEIAKAAESGKNPIRSAIAVMLKKGFLPTQMADSHAISLGGASFYRNRVNTYLKEGLELKQAEEKAFLDFQEIAEESQQSSRPDRISMQQASPLGRIILAFANTPMQYARLMKKAALDLKNKRGDTKTNLAKLAYYGIVQNMIFTYFSNALFALGADEEEEEEAKKKYYQAGNNMADSLLRGLGFGGAAVSAGKNMVLEAIKQYESGRPDYTDVGLEALTLSPPIDSKINKLQSVGRTFTYRQSKEKMRTKGISLDNPIFEAVGKAVSALTNIPLDRVVRKLDNLTTPIRQDVELWQAISLALGYSKWDIGLKDTKEEKKVTKEKPNPYGLRTVKIKGKLL